MARVTIKSLVEQLNTIRELRKGDEQHMTFLRTEINGLKERIKLIAAENEELRQDKRWLKSLAQNLTPVNTNAQSR